MMVDLSSLQQWIDGMKKESDIEQVLRIWAAQTTTPGKSQIYLKAADHIAKLTASLADANAQLEILKTKP